jgi:hypothetical protein
MKIKIIKADANISDIIESKTGLIIATWKYLSYGSFSFNLSEYSYPYIGIAKNRIIVEKEDKLRKTIIKNKNYDSKN